MKKSQEEPETGTVTRSLVKPESPPPPKGNATLERESQGCSSVLFYMVIFLMLDVWKQITSYGMKYYNNNRYPIPQTQVVAITESLKFAIFFAVLIYTQEIKQVKVSFWYAIPSVIYAINNNVYYFALNFVTPPIWNIIIQLRVLFTALTYRIIFKREVTKTQWAALTLLIAAIVMTNMTGGNQVGGSNNFAIALVLAVAGSLMSVFGTVIMEYLFKNDQKPFAEMQMQLYMFSGAMAWVFYIVELYTTTVHTVNETSNWNVVMLMVAGCIILSCTSGISVAFIVKKLDNIVKLYSQSLSNMLTSIACFILFPDHFHLNVRFVMCLLVMFAAIFLYENKNLETDQIKAFLQTHKYRIPPIVAILFLACLVLYFSFDSGVVDTSLQGTVSRVSKYATSGNSTAMVH